MTKHLLTFLLLTAMTFVYASEENAFIPNVTIDHTTATLKGKSTLPAMLVERGVKQAAALWTAADGTERDFDNFCNAHFCKTLAEKTLLFNRICENFEVIYGLNNRISVELQRPDQVAGYERTSIDELFSAYNGMNHFEEDMFASKMAFVIVLNFPHFTLKEKQQNGARWSELEWGFVRLGDVFTSRTPSAVEQRISTVMAAANNYVDNYNIDMEQVGSFYNRFYWNRPLLLISHWGLRDELKASYADPINGVEKQTVLYDVMKRVIRNDIPLDILKHDKSYKWYPSTNQTMLNGIEILTEERASRSRYQFLLDFFHAQKAADEYNKAHENFIQRKFEDEYEISVREAEAMFVQLLTSSEVENVANLIQKRLGRKLQPFDIWYDGFKVHGSANPAELDQIVRTKYPNKEAFSNDLPNILLKMGFDQTTANDICSHVAVDASVGAGHAWGPQMRNDKAMLRTRIGEDGMDYKGYNIGIHEFGHNVEQTITLHEVPNYFLRGVPNTAFTEALAFVFQNKDLELLGVTSAEDDNEDLNTLDIFWNCYEIMGVSLVEIKVWQWMYDHPKANATQLQDAVIHIAKEVWNQYYAPVFKVKDEPILAVYSHMVVDPLYLAAYPIGLIIQFQLEDYLQDKNIGTEVSRIYKQGCVNPDLWMKRAVGEKLSVEPLLAKTAKASKKVSSRKPKEPRKK